MNSRYWVVVPAAGAGRRMGGSTAKQYLALLDKPVIEWSLRPFLDDSKFAAVVVALATDDAYWSTLTVAHHPKIRTIAGGAERVDSVRAGVASLATVAQPNDWVLVHDAARPCLASADLEALIAALSASNDVGGLLATPLTDTVKQADSEQQVAATIPRNGLWRALTPQMFRFDVLQRALNYVADHHLLITDESAAVEVLGLKPRLVAGRADNLKITVPEDMAFAASVLLARIR